MFDRCKSGGRVRVEYKQVNWINYPRIRSAVQGICLFAWAEYDMAWWATYILRPSEIDRALRERPTQNIISSRRASARNWIWTGLAPHYWDDIKPFRAPVGGRAGLSDLHVTKKIMRPLVPDTPVTCRWWKYIRKKEICCRDCALN
jgi:hypothetical protein